MCLDIRLALQPNTVVDQEAMELTTMIQTYPLNWRKLLVGYVRIQDDIYRRLAAVA